MEKTIGEKFKSFVSQNIGALVVALACAVYIVRGLIQIEDTGKSPLEILADGGISMAFGFFICKMLSLQGLSMGEKNSAVISTNELHSKAVEDIAQNINLLDEYCAKENVRALACERTKILTTARIKYSEFLANEYTVYVDGGNMTVRYDDLPKDKKRCVNKAQKLKLTELTASDLTTDGGKASDPNYLGATKKQYETKRDVSQFASKIVCGLVFGYFSVSMIKDISLASIIWSSIQVVMFLTMGTIDLLKSYFFMTDDFRHRTIRKIDHLEKAKIFITEKLEENRNGANK